MWVTPANLAFGLAARPAHQLDTVEPLGGCEIEDLVQAEFRQNGGNESELHDAHTVGRPARPVNKVSFYLFWVVTGLSEGSE